MTEMDKKIIRAYLWEEVIRLGFRPSGSKEQKEWRIKYLQSLKDFLEIDSYPDIGTGYFSLELPFNLYIEFFIEQINKFMVNFFYLPPSNNNEFLWDHDVDGKFFTFPEQEFLTHHNQRSTVIKKFSNEDIKVVLDGLIFHPAAHQHIKSPIDKHEIRIGGGIGNAFLYLFHLRYQFCPDERKRKAEEKRLVELFANALRENSGLEINQLMAQPD
jgi:hypothetical protein